MRAPLATLILAAAGLSLGGCAYGDLGVGLGYGDPYGYGYGPYGGYGYDPYDYGYGGYGSYGYGSPYFGGYYGSPFGWYDNYYYPGTGYYVYDTYRRPHVWSDAQRRYWSQRMQSSRTAGTTTTTVVTRPNWSGFSRRSQAGTSDWQSARQQRLQAWQQRQSERSDRAEARVQSNHRRHDDNRSDDQ
jgi:hypothetical protein